MKDRIIVCDFDGTITKVDAINDFLRRYADKKWLDVENDWVNGKVGTCDAMKLQFGMIKGMTDELFNSFFTTVELDEYFIEFYKLTNKKNIKVVIVSDGFLDFIERVLKIHGITGIDIYSNRVKYEAGKFEMSFPNKIEGCIRNSGTCKCHFIKKFKDEYREIIYIGDGASDFCVADKVDFLFAKNKLSEYCREKNISHVEYFDFKEVINNDRLRLNN